jgi:membrane-associated protein
MLPGIELSEAVSALGYAIALIIFAETGLMVGFFLPGDSLLFTAGALAGINVLHVNIYLMAALFFVAAVLGNTTGYMIGKRFGRKLFHKKDSKLFKKKYLKQAEEFYEKYGALAVMLAQFVPIIRTFNPIVTGISKMPYRKFITYNVLGALIWTGGFTLLGYYVFQHFGQLIDPEKIDVYILPIIMLIIFLSILPGIIHILKDNRRRQTIIDKLSFWRK